MKHSFLNCCLITTFIVLVTSCSSLRSSFDVPRNNVGNLHVLPQPQKVQPQSELAPFRLDSRTAIVYPEGNTTMQKDADFLASYIEQLTGLKLVTTHRGSSRPAISLQLNPAITHAEGYRISINPKGITIEGATETGVFYGVQTLRKILPIGCFKNVRIPSGAIEDYPRFAYRGFMLDVSRHFFSVEYIKKVIDLLALHNINNFHWHLTDDQGWRIEIKKYPQLIAVGSHRKETIVKHGSKEFDGIPVSGFYTQEQAREVVRYAAERHINVIPEIDMPGHMMAALASYPELGCTGGPYTVPTQFGIFADVLCAGNPKALTFATDVLNEIMDIFPSKYIHIGGDECPKQRWEKCPKCQALIAKQGLKSTPKFSKENQLQAYFMGELEKVINARGRQVLAWDELLHGNPNKSTTIMAWTSPKAGEESASSGYATIICPISNLYFSNPRFNQLRSLHSVDRVLMFEPVSPRLDESQQNRIQGVEGCLWTEWTKDADKVEWQILPRMAALSELQWTLAANKDQEGFYRSLTHMLNLYAALGYNIKKDIYEPAIYVSRDPNSSDKAEVTIKTFDHAPIYYTLDGSKPTARATRYVSPLEIRVGTTVRAIALRGDRASEIVTEVIKPAKK